MVRRALVFGNAAWDEVYDVERLPAAGQSVHARLAFQGLGGKGANQAVALARTGVHVTLLTIVGADGPGQSIAEALAREPLRREIIVRPDVQSDRSVVLADGAGQNTIVTTNACAASLSFADCRGALEQARPGDLVLLQGNLTAELTAVLAQAASTAGLKVVFNPSPFDSSLEACLPFVDWLFVNEDEALRLTGLAGRAAVDALRSRGIDAVVLTLGAQGALLGTRYAVVRVPAAAAQVSDVTGAGDCFEAVALSSALRRSADLDETALRHASHAAAYTVSRFGTVDAFPTSDWLSDMFAAAVPDGMAAK